MRILDANILIYAANTSSPVHTKAKSWLESVLAGPETIGFSWNVLLAVVRLTTRRGAFTEPIPVSEALSMVSTWLQQPAAIVVNPGPHHLSILEGLLVGMGTGGNLTSDAHLAALAIEHSAELCSTDSDFARFQGLKWKNPLAA